MLETNFLRFLTEYRTTDGRTPIENAVQDMKTQNKQTLVLNFFWLSSYDETLSKVVIQEFYGLQPYFSSAVQTFVKKRCPEYLFQDNLRQQLREFVIGFYNFPNTETVGELLCRKVGTLCAMRGTIIRTSEVRPEIVIGAFECHHCQSVVSVVEHDFQLEFPSLCSNVQCPGSSSVGSFSLLPKVSKLVDWQKARVQERSQDSISGNLPRSITVILRGDLVDTYKPGDSCIFTGSLVVVPDVSKKQGKGSQPGRIKTGRQTVADGVTGLKSIGAQEMTYSLAFLPTNISSITGNYSVLRYIIFQKVLCRQARRVV